MQWIAAGRIITTRQVSDWLFPYVTPEQRIHNFLESYLVRCYLSCILLVVGECKPFWFSPSVSVFDRPAFSWLPHIHHLQSLNGIVGEVLVDVVDIKAAKPRLDLQHALVAPVMGRVSDRVLIGAWKAAIEALLVEGLGVI